MEKEPISKERQTIDAVLISLSGGVIGIIGAIAASSILSAPNYDTNTAVWAGGATLVGASLALNGILRYLSLRKSFNKID